MTKGSKAALWRALTDIEGSAGILRGVEAIELIGKPAKGLVGLRWRETRMYFGKPATVEKRVTAAKKDESFETRAESDGFLFVSTTRLSGKDGDTRLTTTHDSRPQGAMARLKSAPMFLLRGMVRKALLQDLEDIKAAAEKAPPTTAKRKA